MLLPFKNKKEDKSIEIVQKLITLFEQEEIHLDELTNTIQDITQKPISSNLSFIKERELDPKLLEAYSYFSKEISSISEQNTLDLSVIISFINLFEEKILQSNNRYSVPETNPIIITQREKIPLILKNNRKVILTDNNFDLTDFTCSELIEILRVLDVVVTDNRYDNLRTEIAKQIESISTVSVTQK